MRNTGLVREKNTNAKKTREIRRDQIYKCKQKAVNPESIIMAEESNARAEFFGGLVVALGENR